MQVQAYLIVAAGKRLYAPTLEELAEIAEFALLAGDSIDSLRAHAAGSRPLTREELGRSRCC